ncbi:MAG TPA: hypothetical protein VNT52_01005 [Acidimicrobiales bacterium]|nr:hypothetical protein [Acidimicrobiales bacterium]
MPDDVVEIPIEAYHAAMNRPAGTEFRIVDGEVEIYTPEPPEPGVPQRVTMRQARQALILAGLDQAVEDAIDSLPEPHNKLARAEWEYSQTVERDRPFVQMLAPALGLDDAALDALFVHAASL